MESSLDKRNLDFSFAFNDPEFSDRIIELTVCHEEATGNAESAVSCEPGGVIRCVTEKFESQSLSSSAEKEVYVISALLVAQSEFFKTLFSPLWTHNASIETPYMRRARIQITPEEEAPFTNLLQFMYSGRLPPFHDPECALQLLLLAHRFAVPACVDACVRHLNEVPLNLHMCCVLLRVCAGVDLSAGASSLVSTSTAFLVNRFANFDYGALPLYSFLPSSLFLEFLSLPIEAVEALLASDDLLVRSEEMLFSAVLQWIGHQQPALLANTSADVAARAALIERLAEGVRFPCMQTEELQHVVQAAKQMALWGRKKKEAAEEGEERQVERRDEDGDAGTVLQAVQPPQLQEFVVEPGAAPSLHRLEELVIEALWFKCSSYEKQLEAMKKSASANRRLIHRRRVTLHCELLLQDCYMIQPGQAILLAGGAWVSGKLFSLKITKVTAAMGGSDFGLFLQASQRCHNGQECKGLEDSSARIEFSFFVKEWPGGNYVLQKQPATHVFKGIFRERGYRNLLSPWNDVMKDNGRFFNNGVMALRADLIVLPPDEGANRGE